MCRAGTCVCSVYEGWAGFPLNGARWSCRYGSDFGTVLDGSRNTRLKALSRAIDDTDDLSGPMTQASDTYLTPI